MTDRTVLLTGISGFIAKRIALDLLDAGYRVRGSLRTMSREAEVRDALRAHMADAGALDRLEFVPLDLDRDEGWGDALAGMDGLIHTASPFPMTQPKDESDLIRPAIDGTLRALRAARDAGVGRVVMTSSTVAVTFNGKADRHFTEADWSDPAHPTNTAYSKSKTLAERAAWDFVAENAAMQLTTINPGLVAGRPLDGHYGTSLQLIERLLRGRDPMVPDIHFSVVDVRDVSRAHIHALEREAAVGRRFIAAAGTLSMPEMARILKRAWPDRRIPTRVAPGVLLRLYAIFDPAVRSILPTLGLDHTTDESPAREVLGIDFTPPEAAVLAAAEFLIEAGV